jgi:16S rRNA (adenine1518-N6/adenine1519-N6)-dimethyltransferase
MEEQNLDQHFMVDKKLLRRIVDSAELKDDDLVLEIGPGKGALTELLVEKCQIIAIEIDTELFKKLKEKQLKNLFLMQGNALDLIKEARFNKIVSNIPYSISEPLIKRMLRIQPELIVITIGEKFIQHVESNELLNAIYTLEILELIPSKAFFPEPNIISALIKLKLKDDIVAKMFRELLNQHDKKLKNALLKSFEGILTKNEIRKKTKSFESLDKSIVNISNEDAKKLKKFIVC